MSRVLGWGKEHNSDLDPVEILKKIKTAVDIKLDRWNVSVKPYRGIGLRGSIREAFMYNYISIGVDAQVTLSFHKARESCFYLFSNRIFNKVNNIFLFSQYFLLIQFFSLSYLLFS